MLQIAPVDRELQLAEYEQVPGLLTTLAELRHEAQHAVKRLRQRRVIVISEASGVGCDAEMLPSLVALLRACGIDAQWWQHRPDDARAVELNRRLRRLVLGDAALAHTLDDEDAALFQAQAQAAARELAPQIARDDVLLVHGIGTAAIGALLKRERRTLALWRCTLGLDERKPQTRAAWRFLKDHLTPYDRGLFNCAEYIPQYFTNRASLVPPGVDPLSDKNRTLSLHQVVGTLCSAGLVEPAASIPARPFSGTAQRVDREGRLRDPGELELLHRPLVLQISRWDRLKGMVPLIEGFALLKRRLAAGELRDLSEPEQHRIEIARLVLASTDPAALGDDREAVAAFDEVVATCAALDPELARDVCILALPAGSARENALIVNALQRAASVIIQNSLREGFGLTVAEAGFKGVPVIGSATSGIKLQLRHEIDGLLCDDPANPDAVADSLLALFCDPEACQRYAASAQRRVLAEFLITSQLQRLLRLLSELA
ncbi:MAG: glycosyltransferase [Deltaproteobacteria bacterium]|nr:glycosyltransferase [Deltaproteobacteria bacterium]